MVGTETTTRSFRIVVVVIVDDDDDDDDDDTSVFVLLSLSLLLLLVMVAHDDCSDMLRRCNHDEFTIGGCGGDGNHQYRRRRDTFGGRSCGCHTGNKNDGMCL